MKRGVIIIIVGILLLVITAIVWAVFQMGIIGGGNDQPAEVLPEAVPPIAAGDKEPTPLPQKQVTQVVIAVQNIGRGMEISPDSVTLWDWPLDSLPEGAILGSQADDFNGDGVPDAIEQVLGRRMRTSVVRFEPILTEMLTDRIDLSGVGSDAALAIPSGRVLIAFPLPSLEDDPTTAVAYALRPGDHVDMMISLALIDLDEEFHTKLPNTATPFIVPDAEEGQVPASGLIGRIEEGPLGIILNVVPQEEQRPRLVTQLTVQDAVIVRVGRYPTAEEEELGMDPLAPPTPTPVPEDVEQQGPPAPPPKPIMPQVLVLAVTQQEALVIKFAFEMNANIDFVLRAVGDQALYQTNAVTLQYLMETYNIAVPPKLQYGIEPPVFNLKSFLNQGGAGTEQ